MFKMIGSSLALAVSAGALYYWWTHEHGDLRDDLRHYGEELQEHGKKAKTKLDQA